jgi:hypothetical protein
VGNSILHTLVVVEVEVAVEGCAEIEDVSFSDMLVDVQVY